MLPVFRCSVSMGTVLRLVKKPSVKVMRAPSLTVTRTTLGPEWPALVLDLPISQGLGRKQMEHSLNYLKRILKRGYLQRCGKDLYKPTSDMSLKKRGVE